MQVYRRAEERRPVEEDRFARSRSLQSLFLDLCILRLKTNQLVSIMTCKFQIVLQCSMIIIAELRTFSPGFFSDFEMKNIVIVRGLTVGSFAVVGAPAVILGVAIGSVIVAMGVAGAYKVYQNTGTK